MGLVNNDSNLKWQENRVIMLIWGFCENVKRDQFNGFPLEKFRSQMARRVGRGLIWGLCGRIVKIEKGTS